MSDVESARVSRLLDVLEAVMKHLRSTGGSPEEHAAFAELAVAGRGSDSRLVHEAAHAEWEQRVARREQQKLCSHPRWIDDDGKARPYPRWIDDDSATRPHCAACGKAFPG